MISPSPLPTVPLSRSRAILAVVLVATCAIAPHVSHAATTPDLPTRIAAWLQAWDSQGPHRTGTAGDEAGAAWLAREAEAIAGPGVTIESFAFSRRDPVAVFVEIDGQRIDGEAFFDGPDTPAAGVRGTATDQSGRGPIAIFEQSPTAVYRPEFARLRRESQHAAHVIITAGGAPGLALLNAEWFRTPFGPPTLQLASTERDRVLAALTRRADLRVVVQTRRTTVQARNVVLTLPGHDRSRPPVVVMTPRSSWWQSTSERGGGLVCWLETLRALKANPPGCDVVFTANTGHELGHIGLDEFVARRPGWETRATWIHYGANLGAKGGQLELISAHDDLRAVAVQHLVKASRPPNVVAPPTKIPSGETKDIHKAGGRYITLVGPVPSCPLFHLPQDRWPDAVDVTTIARLAEGTASLVVALTR